MFLQMTWTVACTSGATSRPTPLLQPFQANVTLRVPNPRTLRMFASLLSPGHLRSAPLSIHPVLSHSFVLQISSPTLSAPEEMPNTPSPHLPAHLLCVYNPVTSLQKKYLSSRLSGTDPKNAASEEAEAAGLQVQDQPEQL